MFTELQKRLRLPAGTADIIPTSRTFAFGHSFSS